MKARTYRVKLNLSKLDFPAINGLGEQSDFTQMEVPTMVGNKVQLKITKKFILTETYTNIDHNILSAQSIYEIPVKELNTAEDIYAFFKDATAGLNDAYQYVRKHRPLPDIVFPTPPIERLQREINGVFHLINSRN